MKKVLGLMLTLCIMVSLFSGCTGNKEKSASSSNGVTAGKSEAPKKTVVLKLANFYAETHPQQVALKEIFKPMVEKESGGTIKVELYPNSQLGAEKEYTEGVKLGTVEMALIGSILADKYPQIKLLDLPYMYDSPEQGVKILNSEAGDDIVSAMKQDGIRVLAWTVTGVRSIFNNKRPINSIDDCKDIKLRVPQVKHYIEMAKSLGFSAVTMPMSEVFTALQQKVVDGQENPPTIVLTSGWNEVQKYMALTKHMISFNSICINEKVYQSLTPEQQKILEKAAKESASKEVEMIIKSEASDIETLKSKGIQVTTPDLKPFKEATLAVHESILKEFPQVKTTYDKIMEKKKEIK